MPQAHLSKMCIIFIDIFLLIGANRWPSFITRNVKYWIPQLPSILFLPGKSER